MLNLGPAAQRWLAEVDIHDEEDLRAIGSVAAWRRLKAVSPRTVNRNALYSMEAALLGCHWRDLPAETKARLLAQTSVEGKLK